MTVPEVLEPLSAPLAAVQRLIEQLDDRGVIIGGVAASILGEPRLTGDTDALFVMSVEEVPKLLNLAHDLGLRPRLPDVVEFARRSRMVLLRHESSGIDVDISLGFLPFELETVERSQEQMAGALTLRLPTPEDLIILKAVAHRPQDLLDIEAVIAATTDLDAERIGHWVKQFAELLDAPEIWKDIETLLQADQT